MRFQWKPKQEDRSTFQAVKLERGFFGDDSDKVSPQTIIYDNRTYLNADDKADQFLRGCYVDVETTGLDLDKDPVTQIAVANFSYNKRTGEIVEIYESQMHFSDIDGDVPPHITELTGITKDMIRGQRVPPEFFAPLLEANIVVAHRAEFDRPRVERLMQSIGVQPKNQPWACSKFDIDWKAHGLPSDGLEMLCLLHGFFYDAHDARNDVDAGVCLLSFVNAESGKTYLAEMLANARKKRSIITLAGRFELRETLKAMGYGFDFENKTNVKIVDDEHVEIEKEAARAAGANLISVVGLDPRTRFRK